MVVTVVYVRHVCMVMCVRQGDVCEACMYDGDRIMQLDVCVYVS